MEKSKQNFVISKEVCPNWKTVYLYALDCHTIGIAGKEIVEWKNAALKRWKIKPKENGDEILIRIPTQLYHFYEFQREETQATLSYQGSGEDRILLVVISPKEQVYQEQKTR